MAQLSQKISPAAVWHEI